MRRRRFLLLATFLALALAVFAIGAVTAFRLVESASVFALLLVVSVSLSIVVINAVVAWRVPAAGLRAILAWWRRGRRPPEPPENAPAQTAEGQWEPGVRRECPHT